MRFIMLMEGVCWESTAPFYEYEILNQGGRLTCFNQRRASEARLLEAVVWQAIRKGFVQWKWRKLVI